MHTFDKQEIFQTEILVLCFVFGVCWMCLCACALVELEAGFIRFGYFASVLVSLGSVIAVVDEAADGDSDFCLKNIAPYTHDSKCLL